MREKKAEVRMRRGIIYPPVPVKVRQRSLTVMVRSMLDFEMGTTVLARDIMIMSTSFERWA
jgi:hypothetical protein